jgi:hypothetical protein
VNKNDRMWSKNVAIIVAHPDDETLWAGGTILNHPSWKCFIICLCRKNDPDRAPRFYKALHVLKSQGNMVTLTMVLINYHWLGKRWSKPFLTCCQQNNSI